ncbi:MAG: hypothetical protein ACTS7D_01305 [Candidatus Hodgkinia cicadicola]
MKWLAEHHRIFGSSLNETQPTGWRVNLISLWRINEELPSNKIDGSEGKLFTRTVELTLITERHSNVW